MEAIHSLFNLRWRQQEAKLRPLPEHISRIFIPTANGDLELLTSQPKPGINSDDSAVFFVHGGFGSAGVWLEWMKYLHDIGYGGVLYAYSARNHGSSYPVSCLRMVYWTWLADIVQDFRACYRFASGE